MKSIFSNGEEYFSIYLRNVTKFEPLSNATTFPVRVSSNIVVKRTILFTRRLFGGGDGVGIGLE